MNPESTREAVEVWKTTREMALKMSEELAQPPESLEDISFGPEPSAIAASLAIAVDLVMTVHLFVMYLRDRRREKCFMRDLLANSVETKQKVLDEMVQDAAERGLDKSEARMLCEKLISLVKQHPEILGLT